jgi:hypothetical protein
VASSRVARGRKTQSLIAQWFRAHGWNTATSTEAFLSGKDIRNVDGFSIEVKATTAMPILTAITQAQNNADTGDIPIVVWRPNGFGETRISEWVAATTLEHMTALMRGQQQ